MNNLDVIQKIKSSFFQCLEMGGFDSGDVELSIEANIPGKWGQAGVRKNLDGTKKYFVRINFYLMVRHVQEIEETMKHEFGHLMDFKKIGFSKHDGNWANRTKEFGGIPMVKKASDPKVVPVWMKK